MAALKLSLLGPFLAALDDTLIDSFPTSKVQALLIYLAVEGQTAHRREHLMELLWPGMPLESAQVNLRQTLYRLRKTIPEVSSSEGDQTVPLLLTDRQTVRLNHEVDLQLDVTTFQEALENDPAAAVRLYRGDFLADFYLTDSTEFEAWAERWRENLHRTCLETAFDLAEAALEAGDYPQAQAYAWRQLEFDPLSERAYRQLMTALAKGGQRNAALAQYQVARRRLLEDLELEPSPETTALYEQIQADALKASKEPSAPRKRKPGEMPVFLLTDIEGSTRLWDTYRQAMLPALLQHNTILEECITRHGGRILELRGDGVKAVFEGVNPLQCMLDIQMALGTADWGEIGDLSIRMGLHGVPPVRKGFDYFIEDDKYYGPVLNHTARIMDAGHGGQILASEQIYNTFTLPAEARWEDFGAHPVKSLDQPLQIYGLLHPDLPLQAFPSLRTGSVLEKHVEAETPTAMAEIPRHNLAAQATSFIGRETELAELEIFLDDPEIRLITIVGPGGMGKTRLAEELACRQLKVRPDTGEFLFPDGVFFVPLAPLNNSGEIPSAIANAINLPVDSGQSMDFLEDGAQPGWIQKKKLFDVLKPKQLLLILDNLEHLIPDIEIITELIEASPVLRILATSRERLRVMEEQVYPIYGLEIPGKADTDQLKDYSAVELFLQRARRLVPGFEINAGDRSFLIKICQLLGGMPLGLELAASWIDVLSVEEIASEIQNSLEFLETDIRNVPERHRSLIAVLDSTWRLLDSRGKQVFARMSVFRGSFSRKAAERVTNANLRILAELVNKSLLVHDHKNQRYQIHEVLRQYSAVQLVTQPQEEQTAQQRHSEYYCEEVASRHQPQLEQGIQVGIDQFELDAANILIAWDWAIQYEKLALINLAIDGICAYYEWMDRLDEGLSISQSVLEAVQATQVRTQEESILRKRLEAKAILWLGFFNLGERQDRAARYLTQAVEMIEQLKVSGIEVSNEEIKSLVFQGNWNIISRNYDRAKDFYKEALELDKEISQNHWILWALSGLGSIADRLGLYDESAMWAHQYLAEAREQGNHSAEIRALGSLGWVARRQKSYQKAQGYFEESTALAKDYNHREDIIRSLNHQAFLHLFLGRFEHAIELLEESVALSDTHGSPYYIVQSIAQLGVAHWLSGHFDQADFVLNEAFIYGQKTDLIQHMRSMIHYSEYLVLVGHYHQSSQLMTQLERLIPRGSDLETTKGWVPRIAGWIALVQGDYSGARLIFHQSVEYYKSVTNIEWTSWAQAGLAASAMLEGEGEEAHQIYQEALRNSIELQSFIPLLFLLPFVCLHLSTDYPDLARDVYIGIQASPFLAKAQFFKDTVYRQLPDDVKHIESMAATSISESELIQYLWETATKILTILEAG